MVKIMEKINFLSFSLLPSTLEILWAWGFYFYSDILKHNRSPFSLRKDQKITVRKCLPAFHKTHYLKDTFHYVICSYLYFATWRKTESFFCPQCRGRGVPLLLWLDPVEQMNWRALQGFTQRLLRFCAVVEMFSY